MNRVTKKDLENIVSRIARLTGEELVIEYAYGRPRVYIAIPGSTGVSELSPRLSKRELAEWLWAFEKGLTHKRR